MSSDPLRGVGAGRFAEVSPTAADPDLQWAHSAALQIGAELGVVGLVLFVGILVAALLMLGRDSMVLAALPLPTSVDYVLQFPWVLVAYGVALGGIGLAASVGATKPWLTPPSP